MVIKKETETKEPAKKTFVKYVKTVNTETFFMVIGFSFLFIGMILGLFSIGIYLEHTMLYVPFMMGGAGFVVLWMIFLKWGFEDMTYNAETYYTEDDFDRVDTIGVY